MTDPEQAEPLETGPDPLPDPGTDVTAEELDEDRLGVDPLEEGVEPPEGWAAADRFGTTAQEQAEGQPLGERLAQEEPDVQP